MKPQKWLLACAIAGLFSSAVPMAPALAQVVASTASVAGEPYDLTAASYPSPTQATISWASDSPAVQGFRVERRPFGSRSWSQVAYLAEPARSFVDSGLLTERSYEYRVLAYRNGNPAPLASIGQVLLTTPSLAATPADYAAAAMPRGLDVQPLSSTDIMLSWHDATSDETGFKVERQDPDGTWRAIAQTGANVTLFRDTQLQPASTYLYRVSAERTSGAVVPGAPAGAATPAAGVAAVYFVDAVKGSNLNPGTEARPWQTIQKAHGTMLPGHTVLVRKGTYTATNYTIVQINRSGAPGAWITYRNFPGERPKLRSTMGKNNHAIEIRDAAYVVIDGFEIEGHVKEISPEVAQYENDFFKANPSKYPGPIVDSNGISVAGKTFGKTHHVVVRNNVVYDTPGGGINGQNMDYLTVENNRVFNTSKYSPYGTSAISLLTPQNTDSNSSLYKLVVRNNVVSNATNLFPCNCFGFKQPTDGNGIIMDSFNKNLYTGRSLVTNNISFNNGGRGIHMLNSSYIDVLSNTVVRNGTIAITGDGEITAQRSKFVRVYNNIIVARADRPANSTFQSTDVDFSHNIVFGGKTYTATPGAVGNRMNTDPKFAGGSGILAYQLAANSPAVNTAWTGYYTPSDDVFRAPRPRGGVADVGAIESY